MRATWGIFQFRVMPFGLANAPGIFQQMMSIVLIEMESFTIAYLGDILMFPERHEKDFNHLRQVLGPLRRHRLPKCQFLREETKYLGFVINEDGI